MMNYFLSQKLLIEREYVKENKLRNKHYNINEGYTNLCEGIRALGVVINSYINDKPLLSNLRSVGKNLKETCETKRIKNITIIRGLTLIPLNISTCFAELCNKLFKESENNVALLWGHNFEIYPQIHYIL
jgi:hypothetical protein